MAGVKRIDKLTPEQEAMLDPWADKWIAIGLSTDRANRELFEGAVKECYGFAGYEEPKNITWVDSPLVLAIAAPLAALIVEPQEILGPRQKESTLHNVINYCLSRIPDKFIQDEAIEAIKSVTGVELTTSPGNVKNSNPLYQKVRSTVMETWTSYIGGQFWAGGWWWGGAYTSFFREVCHLELEGNLWERAIAYEKTIQSACWWWPHKEFVMVSERPTAIHREQIDPNVTRDWNSHRLHSDEEAAILWPDGWGVYSIHGVRVPEKVVLAPETMTAAEILAEPNLEVRRVMIDQFGADRLMEDSKAKVLDIDSEWGTLYQLTMAEDEPLTMVKVINSTPEPDGSYRDFFIRVPPTVRTAHEACSWTFGYDNPEDYNPLVQT